MEIGYWTLLIFFCAFVGSFVEVVFQQELEESSGRLIQGMQNFDQEWIVLVFKVLDVVTGLGFVTTSLIIYWCGNRFKGALSVLLGISGALLASFLKMCFVHPRPLYKFDYLSAYSCSSDPGFPSGHSLSSGSVAFFLLYQWLKDKTSPTKKVLTIFFILLAVVLNRLYLAAHFYFQIAMGFCYSLCLVSLVVRHDTLHWLKRTLSDSRYQIHIHVFGLFTFAACLTLYYLRDASPEIQWKENYLKKCGKDISEVFLFKNAVETSAIGFLVGFCYGYRLSAKGGSGYQVSRVLSALAVAAPAGLLVLGAEFAAKVALDGVFRILACFAIRYAAGILMSYLVPLVLDRWSEKEQSSYKALVGTN
jgi:membrane-associated phospholipid phosphatase